MNKRNILIGLTSLLSWGAGHSFLQAQSYSLRTNIAGLLAGNINLEGSAKLSPKLSVHLPMQVRPFSLPQSPLALMYLTEGRWFGYESFIKFGKIDHMQNITATPGLRYWTNGVYNRGIFFGAHLIGTLYKFGGDQLDNTYRQGWGAGAGVSVGYTYELAPRWNIEAEIGGGAIYRSYDIYTRAGYKESKGTSLSLNLTRFAINIAYLL